MILILIMALTVLTRFYGLGDRVMSHDEVNHVIPSFDFSEGRGYRYDPITHGPLQFHLIALSYFLFGDNDFTTRIPAVLFSVATVAIALLLFKRYLGKVGAIAAGAMCLISPFMLFYGRYQRNEAFIVVWGMLTIYTILRYLEKKEAWVLFLFTAVNAFHFIDKATSYIFAAQQLIFLAVYFIYRLMHKEWVFQNQKKRFIIAFISALLLITAAGSLYLLLKPESQLILGSILALGILGVMTVVIACVFAVKGLGWSGIRSERSFDLLILLGTLILPLLAALPIKLAGFNPLDYTSEGIIRAGIAIGVLTLVSAAVGIWWGKKNWLLYFGLFYAIFIVFYSTFFTYPQGVAVGFIGALGYWMEQQAVNRGGQPFYYYALLQIPVYEFLPAIGVFVSLSIATIKKSWQTTFITRNQEVTINEETEIKIPVLPLIIFWFFSSLLAFSYAGEKMPWLTIHITMPMILAAAWGINWLVEWGKRIKTPFVNWKQVLRGVVLVGFAGLAILTARAAYRAAFIYYDYPLEYLVYAHAADDPKILLEQIEKISRQTTDGLDIVVAYDNNVRYPYWWYLRHYPNRIDFNTQPSRDLQRAAIIVVSEDNYGKIAPIVKDNYVQFDMMRMWWPNQDYMKIDWNNISSERNAEVGGDGSEMTIGEYLVRVWGHISPFFTDPEVRSAIWQIWFNRDYSEYAALKNSNSFTLENWNTRSKMRTYIRKDVASLVWGFQVSDLNTTVSDPYESIFHQISPDIVIGQTGSSAGQFQAPRSVAVASDGSVYVADSRNNRIEHISSSGEVINTWGKYADIAQGDAPGGTFNEPWGVAVAPDGSVYVADTWNYRIQKFTSEGVFLSMFGTNGFGETSTSFYGPRSVAVDSEGNLFVADTGNKRILVFDPNGNYIDQFGSPGMGFGELDEPVGIAVDSEGNVYVADTWNLRVQVFSKNPGGQGYSSTATWDVNAWFGQSMENKPFIAVDGQKNVYISDPEGCRIIKYSTDGNPLGVWGDCGYTEYQFTSPVGLAVDGEGGLWVSDAGENNRLLYFSADSLSVLGK
ncbi:MAG TPA: glycosyltransferase family 39 protein [Anaerolineales bacterium]|nr:glycosyltransferase family 39 protein [Anaerolineales bacterium]